MARGGVSRSRRVDASVLLAARSALSWAARRVGCRPKGVECLSKAMKDPSGHHHDVPEGRFPDFRGVMPLSLHRSTRRGLGVASGSWRCCSRDGACRSGHGRAIESVGLDDIDDDAGGGMRGLREAAEGFPVQRDLFVDIERRIAAGWRRASRQWNRRLVAASACRHVTVKLSPRRNLTTVTAYRCARGVSGIRIGSEVEP